MLVLVARAAPVGIVGARQGRQVVMRTEGAEVLLLAFLGVALALLGIGVTAVTDPDTSRFHVVVSTLRIESSLCIHCITTSATMLHLLHPGAEPAQGEGG